MLNCTWDDREPELVLRKVQLEQEEQQKLHSDYQALREKYRQTQPSASSAAGFDQAE
jgi:hypothetical protein